MENDRFQDLVLNHLAKLTQEMTELKTDVGTLKSNQDLLKTEVDQIKASVIRIENDNGEKLRALFDAREAQMDVNERIFDALKRIENKVDYLSLTVSTHDALLKKVK